MITTLLCIVGGSFLARALFKYCLDKKYDVAGDFQGDIPDVEMRKIISVEGVDVKTVYKKVYIEKAPGYEMSENSKLA